MPSLDPAFQIFESIVSEGVPYHSLNGLFHLSFKVFEPSFSILGRVNLILERKMLLFFTDQARDHAGLSKTQAIYTFENLIQKLLDILRVFDLSQDLDDFLIRKEVEPRKVASFCLKVDCQPLCDDFEFFVGILKGG